MDGSLLGVLDARDNTDGSGVDLRCTARINDARRNARAGHILFNGKIFTAEGQQFVEALTIQGDRIAAVGNSEQIRKLAGSPTRLIDLRGRVVIPGLNDAHNHIRIRPANRVDPQFTGRGSLACKLIRFDSTPTFCC
jgi:hypothetical protein